VSSEERWLPMPGYEEIYSISSAGRARVDIGGRGRIMGQILKPRYTEDGYVKYMLRKEGKSRAFLAHRLVYAAFVRDLEGGEEIDHLNGTKDDNSLGNLEPVSRLENIRRSFKRGRNMVKGSSSPRATMDESVVADIRARHRGGAKQAELCKTFNIPAYQMSRLVLRKTWKHVP